MAQANLEGARAKYELLRSQAVKLNRELDGLNQESFELENLTRDVRMAEDAFYLFKKKHEESRISTAMDQQELVNVSIAQPGKW